MLFCLKLLQTWTKLWLQVINGLDIIKVGQTFNYSYRENSGVAIGGMYWNDVRNLLAGNPLVPLYDEEDEYYDLDDVQSSGIADM